MKQTVYIPKNGLENQTVNDYYFDKKEGYFFTESELPLAQKALLEISQIPQIKPFVLQSDATERYQHIVKGIKLALRDAAEKALSNAGFDRFYIKDYIDQTTQ